MMKFESPFLREFPEIATPVQATPVAEPKVLIESEEVKSLLGLSLSEPLDPAIFSGNQVLSGSQPYATRYGGHQFGVWAGQLGDGRALYLGELQAPDGRRYELQLKGAGQTPFSRRGDGRAVLRSSLREHLCSEAMAALGVPTTRSLCCVLTGESVIRDILYDGNPAPEPGAIVTRVAPSFLRLGHFQILATDRNPELMGRLVDHAIARFYPGLSREEWFQEVCVRTARLMVHWQRVGFVHGVMNTDNLSVLGLTIDYGPYGWMDVYDPNFTPNTTDAEHRRYRFANQPAVAYWNLNRFADALSLLTPGKTEWLQAGLEAYGSEYNREVLQMMSQKLGLVNVPESELLQISEGLDGLLQEAETDMTMFFRAVAEIRARPDLPRSEWEPIVRAARYSDAELSSEWDAWVANVQKWMKQDSRSPEEAVAAMNRVNPYFVLRNFLVQEALDALAVGDLGPMQKLARALTTPYEENEHTRPFFRKLPDWARSRPGCSALSCSS